MKSSHGYQEEGGLMLSRPTVDVRDVIYGLTSSDCTSAHPEVTKGDQGGLPDKVDQKRRFINAFQAQRGCARCHIRPNKLRLYIRTSRGYEGRSR
jgi:hypothetical protein